MVRPSCRVNPSGNRPVAYERDGKCLFRHAPKLSCVITSAGTTSIRSTVAMRTPKPTDVANGTRCWAYVLVSKIKGATPANVVTEVSRMARKRSLAPVMIASLAGIPDRLRSLMNLIIISESFTTTPLTPISPYIDQIPRLRPSSMCPATTPIAPNGTAAMMMRGWE